MKHQEYVAEDAVGLAELIRTGEVTSDEVVAAARARIAAVNPILNAIVQPIDPTPEADATGPLAGVPLVLKEMDGYLAGYPCSYASRSLADWIPDQDSETIRRYKAAGLRIIGKANCPELGILGITEPELHGPTRNPWNTNHVPGGSSGGPAAAVAAGIVPVAVAGDGGGSIRIPASACGLFGLKPSRGLVPLQPEADPWLGLVSRHVLSRSVRDSAAFLDIASAPMTGSLFNGPARPRSYAAALAKAPRRLTIGVSRRSFLDESLHPDCLAAVDAAAALMESLGHRVVEFELPIDATQYSRAYLTIVAASVSVLVMDTKAKTGREPKPSLFERSTWFLKQVGDAIAARELIEAHEVTVQYGQAFANIFGSEIDVHLSSTLAAPPVRIGELGIDAVEKTALSVLQRIPVPSAVLRQALKQLAHDAMAKTPNTQIFNMTGQPAMSLPLHWNDQNLPIGVQVAGAYGADAQLLQLAQQVHDAQPWFGRLPEV